MTTIDIDTAIARIETGITYGVVYLANGIVINAGKAIAEEWSKNAAKAMIEYTKMYPEKIYNTDKPLFQNTMTLLRAMTFEVTMVSPYKVSVHLSIDDDVEPENLANVRKIFKYLTYGVNKKTINIPARPLFYDVLGAMNTPLVINKSFKRKTGLQDAFDKGFDVGINNVNKDASLEQLMRHANKTIGKHKIYSGKITNYHTGELRWL